MYSNCLFCHADLGRNEAVESFPVGRRLAYDVANGRFWVICAACRRWNLSPLEERWDAMDQCERLFEQTRRRMSTDNIGLARLNEGTELVRVGAALRPEMAAWRFGEQLAARRRKYSWLMAGGAVATAGLYLGVKTAGAGFLDGEWARQSVQRAYERVTRLVLPMPMPMPMPMPTPSASPAAPRIDATHARNARLQFEGEDRGLILTVPTVAGVNVRYDAEAATRVLAKLLAKVNASGGRKEDERLAVAMLETAAARREPDLFSSVVEEYAAKSLRKRTLGKLGSTQSLALEMALSEQQERQLLIGELIDLEFAWKEAEELARIADTLVPSSIERTLAKLKAQMRG